MIFKINYNASLLKAAKQNTYISLCEKQLSGSRLAVHCILYKALSDNKIINFNASKFSYEIKNDIAGKLIKCFVSNEKAKLYCKLEQLVKPINIHDRFRGIFSSINFQRGEIAREIDEEIFAEIDAASINYPGNYEQLNLNQRRFNVIDRSIENYNAGPIRRSLDYQGIARRALVIEPMPEGALPTYDRDIDIAAIQDIDNLPVVVPYENAMPVYEPNIVQLDQDMGQAEARYDIWLDINQ